MKPVQTLSANSYDALSFLADQIIGFDDVEIVENVKSSFSVEENRMKVTVKFRRR